LVFFVINTNMVCVWGGGGIAAFSRSVYSSPHCAYWRQATVLKDCSFNFLKHTQNLARVWMPIALCLCECEASYVVYASIFSVGTIQKRSCLKPVKTKIVVGRT
jgi:hypothetical protein